MKKLIHYILIGIMLNWNVAVLADDDVDGCKWETVEETEQYLQEQCISADGNQYSARIRSKPIDDSITYVKTDKKDANPIQKYRDSEVLKTPIGVHDDLKIAELKEEVEITAKKIDQLKIDQAVEEKKKVELDVVEKAIEHVEEKKTAETEKAQVLDPKLKKELNKKDVHEESDKKIIAEAEEKAWKEVDENIEVAEVEKEPKINWMTLYQMLPRLILENEKVKAAELDYEAAVESLKSEYTAYYPQVTISIGNNWEDDRTPSKGTYPNNTITHDSKQGIQKSITITQMIWDGGRTTATIDKAKHTAQQAYYRLELATEDVIIEAISAWLNLQKAYNTHEANKKVEANAKITLAMTIEKVKAGQGSKLEQLQIEQQYRTYQTIVMTSNLQLDSAVQRFQNVWRFYPTDVASMPVPLADLLGIIPDSGRAVTDNTTLKIANLDIEIAKEQKKFSDAEFRPRVDGKLSYTEKDGELSGGYDTHDAQKEEWRADITMTWKLFNFKNKYVNSADRIRMEAAVTRYADVKRTTQEQFTNAWNNYVLVEKNLETLKRTVEINEEMYQLTLADFQAGNSPIMAVFGMKTAHIMSEVAYANAQLDLLIARYQLHKVLGLVDPKLD
jgi:adhesin transport system outer membrane protein